MRQLAFFFCLAASLFGRVTTSEAADERSRSIRFDSPVVLPAQPIAETPESDRPTPSQEGRRWIDIGIPITLWPGLVDPTQIERLEVEIVDLSGDAFVIDHLPRREAISEFSGTMSVERTHQRHWHADLALDSSLVGVGAGRAGINAADRRQEVERFERRLPREIVAIGGTSQQGRGAIFRLERSIEMTLEGTHPVRVLWSVPISRRHGLLRIDCRAIGQRRNPLTGASESTPLARERLLSAYFDAGDAASRAVAERWAANGLALRSAVAQVESQRETERRAEAWKNWLRPDPTKLPKGWLERLVVDGRSDEFREISPQLPQEIQRLGLAYLESHREMVAVLR